MSKRHIISISLIFFLTAIFLTSCLSLVPEDGSKTTSTKTITELADLIDQDSELLLTEDKSLTTPAEETIITDTVTETTSVDEGFTEELLDNYTVSDEVFLNADAEDISNLTPSEENSVEDVSFEPVVITGTSILEPENSGFTSTPDTWMTADSMSQKIEPATFVSAEELPLEVAGKDIQNTVTVEPEIIWEDEVYTPDVVVSSNPVDISNERDILKEYEQFVADLGDDYTVAKSDDITFDDFSSSVTAQKNSSDGNENIIWPSDSIYTDEEDNSSWTEVPSENTADNTAEAENKTSGVGSFFKGVWGDIKALFVNLGSTVKGWFVKK